MSKRYRYKADDDGTHPISALDKRIIESLKRVTKDNRSLQNVLSKYKNGWSDQRVLEELDLMSSMKNQWEDLATQEGSEELIGIMIDVGEAIVTLNQVTYLSYREYLDEVDDMIYELSFNRYTFKYRSEMERDVYYNRILFFTNLLGYKIQ